MFKLEQGKNNFINRANKTKFNSIIIPTSLQEPVFKTKPIYMQKINNKINNKWLEKKFMEEQLKTKIQSIKPKKTVKIITSQENLIKIKRGLQLYSNSLKNTKPFYLTEGSFTVINLQEELDKIPTSPTNVIATPGENTITVSFTEPYSNSEIINYLYSIDWGNFEAFNPAQNKSPVIIKNLENGASYIISLKAENKHGTSESSKPISVFTGLLGFPNE
jgi:hypothetical protein